MDKPSEPIHGPAESIHGAPPSLLAGSSSPSLDPLLGSTLVLDPSPGAAPPWIQPPSTGFGRPPSDPAREKKEQTGSTAGEEEGTGSRCLLLVPLLGILNANRKIRKRTDTDVAFTREYSRVSIFHRERECTN